MYLGFYPQVPIADVTPMYISAKYRTHVFLEIADTSSATESVADWADSASDFDANTPAAYLEACAEHDRIVFLIHGG